jgi:hypothetical protein
MMMRMQALLLIRPPALAIAFAPSQGSVAFRPSSSSIPTTEHCPCQPPLPPQQGILKTVSKGWGKASVKLEHYGPMHLLPSDDPSAASTLPFVRISKQKMVIGDTMIEGWKKKQPFAA